MNSPIFATRESGSLLADIKLSVRRARKGWIVVGTPAHGSDAETEIGWFRDEQGARRSKASLEAKRTKATT